MTDPDAAAVEAVAKAIAAHVESEYADEWTCEAEVALAALSALGWVDGTTKAKLVQRVNNLERGLDTVTRERDALRAALELIAAPVRADGTWNRCREACEQIAREALNLGKTTP
ncbi:hypothetical protein [Methylibium sp.]|uniref:hypothetical protein n=1 Tax=Methylibium sp. TaxID=2067992 RepID=UPI00185ADCBF|nr:hypothetical protein [Methylibium sp.]MBA3589665.1 hypothetical protein [Methylibium sp.]